MHRRAFLSLILMLAVVAALTGCGAEDQAAELKANPWVATQIQTPEGMQAPLNGSSPAIFFNADGTASGNATVNSFKGPYTTEARNIKIGPLVSTQWTGPQMESAQDAIVLEALAAAARYHIKDGVMQLSDASGELLMSLAVAQEPALVGPVWMCTDYASGTGELVSVVGTTPIVAQFAPDGTLEGSGGVNQYSTQYAAEGANMTIGPQITTTRMAGPEPLMAQEASYLEAMVKTASYRIEAYQLKLLDAAGNVLVAYTPVAPKN